MLYDTVSPSSTVTAPVTEVKNPVQLARELGPLLAGHVSTDEKNRKLSPEVFNALKKAGFYKLFLPRSLGGLEASLVTTARIIEELARHHAAAGWSLMVANSNLTLAGFLPEEGIEEIFISNPDTFVAGSVHPPMMATKTQDGYLINGRNPLVSNVHEAEWICVLALVCEEGKPKFTDGRPEIIGVYMKASDCIIHDTWSVIGMRATDSNDVEAKNVFVPDRRLFPLDPEKPMGKHFQGTLAKIPAAGSSVATLLPAVSLGVARNAIEELKILAAKKVPLGSMVSMRDRGVVQRKLGKAEALVQSSRIYLYEMLDSTWKRVENGEELSLRDKADLLLAATHVNQSCVEAVELCYTAAGSSGIYTRNNLSRYMSDAQVLRQHGFINESRYETGGQIHFGLAPDLKLIEF
jgi:alkylation response protein AidB-like acyl-CoA dehydrogenase